MKLAFICAAFTTFLSCSFAQEGKKPVVIAHRGAPGYLPEHTLEGAAMAHAWGVDYIEPDLVMTKDGELVVLHDHHLDTTTDAAKKFPQRARDDGRYYAIDFTLKEIKTLKVHERTRLNGNPVYPQRFPLGRSSFEVPTFKEFIELVQGLNKSTGKDIGIYPEIKKPEFHLKEGKDITQAAIKLMRRYGYENGEKAIIQCFWPQTLKRLKNEFKTKISLVQLIADDNWGESSANYSLMRTSKGLKQVAEYADGVGPWLKHLIKADNGGYRSSGVVEAAKEAGLAVHPYTHRVEELPRGLSEREFFRFVFSELKIDGIFSDYGDRVLKYLDK